MVNVNHHGKFLMFFVDYLSRPCFVWFHHTNHRYIYLGDACIYLSFHMTRNLCVFSYMISLYVNLQSRLGILS